MKIALIQCPAWGRDCPSYTMALLSSLLRSNNHNVFNFDLNNVLYLNSSKKYKEFWDNKDLYSFWSDKDMISKFMEDNRKMIEFQIENILKTDSKLIVFTVHFTSLLVSLEVAKIIKNIDKSRFIAFGGPECSLQHKGSDLIKEDVIDAVSIGEGDLLIQDLAKKLSMQEELDSCRGLLFKKNGNIVNSGNPKIISDLDSLPFPDYTDFQEDISLGLYRQPERLEIFDSRGCFIKCNFCSEWQFWQSFRFMSGARIFHEIKHQIKIFPGVRYFYFIGSFLNGNIKSLDEFCNLVIENSLNIEWAGQAIIREEMDRKLLNKMRRAGCVWLGYGIESGSQKIIDNMNKKFSLNAAERILKDTHDVGINVQANFMFGIPGETEEDFEKTLQFLKNNRKNIDSVLASQSFCVIDKGTYLYNNFQEFNIKDRDHHLYWESDKGYNNYYERFNRYEEFCKLALSLDLPETSGVLKKKPDKYKLLGDYYYYKEDYIKAVEYYEKSKKEEIVTDCLIYRINKCYENIAIEFDNNMTIMDINRSRRKFNIIHNNLEINNFKKLDTLEAFKILNSFKNEDFEALNILELANNLNLNKKQTYILKGMYDCKTWGKLSNFILVELQKIKRESVMVAHPYWLVIDPTNFCNLKCPFCPTGQVRNTREKSILSFRNFKKIIDRIGKYIIHIDFCNWGEPFINEDIFKMVKYAKKYHIDTKVDTNLHFLNKSRIIELLESDLDHLIISIDGVTPETYSRYRVDGDFKKVMNNLKLLIYEKKKINNKKPFITWQFLVFKHNEHEIKKVKKIGMRMGVDYVGITRAFIGNEDWIPKNEKYNLYSKKRNNSGQYEFKSKKTLCNWPWEAMVINANGTVSVCCSVEDEKYDFGNIFEKPFNKIWNNKYYKDARNYIAGFKKASFENNICFQCEHAGLINIDIGMSRSYMNYDFSKKLVSYE